MATPLTKTIKRETLRMVETHGRHRGKPILVELRAGDELAFRVKGTRQEFTIYLGHCFRLAQMQAADEHYKQAMEKYKNRGNRRMRKPKRSTLPYSPMYFKALSK